MVDDQTGSIVAEEEIWQKNQGKVVMICHLLWAAPPSSLRLSTVEQQEAFNSSPPPPATSALSNNEILLVILIIVLVRPRHTNLSPWPTLCSPCRRATWGTLGSCQTSSGCKSASASQSFISRKLIMMMMTVMMMMMMMMMVMMLMMMMMMMETCAARNIDRSGGRQADARGRALVEALETIISITIITYHNNNYQSSIINCQPSMINDHLATESTLTGSTAPSSKWRLTISLRIGMSSLSWW